ncbi:MAG: hypothetical protein DYG89_18905 [Caldilinea sp. CFX5]|nr:hypothetical protein [Caldilinea sp. CFX5]
MKQQVRYGKQIATVKSADGVEGILIRSLNHRYFFRVYHGNGDFTDYDLRHFDLAVTICDSDAAFYQVGDRHILDHAPATLGLEEVHEKSE